MKRILWDVELGRISEFGDIPQKLLEIDFFTDVTKAKIVNWKSLRYRRGGRRTARVTRIAVAWSNIDHALHAYAVVETLDNTWRNRQAADECCNLVEHGSDLNLGCASASDEAHVGEWHNLPQYPDRLNFSALLTESAIEKN